MLRRHKLLIGLSVTLMVLYGGWLLYRGILVRTFRVPTNAMAPTIWGRHKDLLCPKCGCSFRVSASEEVDGESGSSLPDWQVVWGTCPMCRHTVDIRRSCDEFPSKRGETIAVAVFAYRFGQPRRWDMALFRYPADPQTTFVKRIVGVPNETVRISGGDIFVRPEGQGDFSIVRKPPDTVLAMLHVVHDNDYVLPAIIGKSWPARWQSLSGPKDTETETWIASKDQKAFSVSGSEQGETWLRYQHFVPSREDWKTLFADQPEQQMRPEPQLITDFFSGNTAQSRQEVRNAPGRRAKDFGLHWVGDLAVACTVQTHSRSGQVIFELVEGGRLRRCRLDLSTGTARLSVEEIGEFRPAAETMVRGPGEFEILFANVDDRLLLWIDGELIEFDAPSSYDSPGSCRPQPADLAPAGIGSMGACVRISHLRLLRDVYYIAVGSGRPMNLVGYISDFDPDALPYDSRNPQGIVKLLTNPEQWGTLSDKMHQVEFRLGPKQYLMLGDNSARSKDSRLWELEGAPYYVRRDQLLGKVLR